MSRNQLKRIVRRELVALNETIDWKIVKGLPYQAEARRHKFLLQRIGVAA